MKFIIYFTLVSATGLITPLPPQAAMVSSIHACNQEAERLKAKMDKPKGYTILHECRELT